jgi:heme/copper-type cytochrome/quinol oxidase subunit 3
MSTDTKFHIHHDAPEVVGRRERLGVRLLIVADGAFVFGMVFTWFYLRNLNVGTDHNGWTPTVDGHHPHIIAASVGWYLILPLIAAALLHRSAMRSGKSFGSVAVLTFLALLGGSIYQWYQLAHLPFIVPEIGIFEGTYASTYTLMAGANMFHYLLGTFIALGLVIRARRADVDPVLESWRMKTASSWFTWIAISGVICAITTSIVN